MRTLSFVDNIEFEYHGNIFNKAMISGDVDNDTGNELVIGNKHGEVVIFKGASSKPWRKCSDLGMITCVGIGDICNHGKNYLLTLSAEGWCHVVSVLPDSQKEGESCDPDVKPVHKQQLFANNKAVLIADIDGDGQNEMVVAYTDRRVRCFRWQQNTLPDLAHSLSPGSANRSAASQLQPLQGKFVTLETWHLAGQIGSVTMNRKKDGSIDLMASQPGGTYVTLLLPGQGQKKVEQAQGEASAAGAVDAAESQSDEKLCDVDAKQIYHPLGSTRCRNPCITTEVVANIRRRKSEEGALSNYSAICTLDGTITLIDVDSRILWSLYVDHQLFTLAKLDVTNDGAEEVVACSWDGHTYFINLNKDAVRFQFGENVAAFCAGYYAVEGKRNVPCLIYATFNNQIKMYYNIRIPNIGITSLLDSMKQQPDTQRLLSYFNCDANDPNQVRQLYHWCLYGYQPKPS